MVSPRRLNTREESSDLLGGAQFALLVTFGSKCLWLTLRLTRFGGADPRVEHQVVTLRT